MRIILPVIVISQFLCTSLWFAGNSIVQDIARYLDLAPHFLADLTSVIQFGFISGTLAFSILSVADRFSPSRVFFISAIFAALANLGICIPGVHIAGILLFRFITGFFLAGIYPVGMKIAADYYQQGLGKSLGFLVGATVIGTAFPHLLKDIVHGYPWKFVLYITSGLSFIGGICILLFVPDGPYRKRNPKPDFTVFLQGFRNANFRSASFGYFGHMWELYTFWAFVPLMLTTYNQVYPDKQLPVSLLSFIIIAAGGPGCVLGGILSQRFGAKKIAVLSLSISCLCCIASPLFILSSSSFLLVTALLIWGLTVIADSPLFSTLVSQHSPNESRGASITIVTCIGFAITIVSIQFIKTIGDKISPQFIYMLLGIGPIFGLINLLRKKSARTFPQL